MKVSEQCQLPKRSVAEVFALITYAHKPSNENTNYLCSQQGDASYILRSDEVSCLK
jgi:hypothetical protein